MARPYIPEKASPYYPRRARWYAPFFYFTAAARRRVFLDRITGSREPELAKMLAAFFIPGLAVYWGASRLWGRLALLGNIGLFAIFIVWLGYPAANLAFGMLVSIHATGFVFYCTPMLAGESFRSRLGFTFLVLLAIACLIYYPARSFVQAHLVMPVRMNGQVIVLQRNFATHKVQRNDFVAYMLHEDEQGEAHNGGAVRVQTGMGLARVLAVSGDRVVFSTGTFSVNGQAQPDLPHMPTNGEWVVPENHWFVWPNLDVSGHGNVGEARISSTMMNLASVNEDQFFGKPLARWFWRKQILP